ncbi:Eh Domain-Containing Protein 1 [Manis pentadactyla]|nr:Eh Domain-Containing Protein 1 [Manis pentadactyla]
MHHALRGELFGEECISGGYHFVEGLAIQACTLHHVSLESPYNGHFRKVLDFSKSQALKLKLLVITDYMLVNEVPWLMVIVRQEEPLVSSHAVKGNALESTIISLFGHTTDHELQPKEMMKSKLPDVMLEKVWKLSGVDQGGLLLLSNLSWITTSLKNS